MTPVSVVVTVLNEAQTIGPLLEDLLGQDQAADEVVVADGGSTDGTQDVVARYARGSERSEIRFLSEPGANISRGRNRGIAQARNELVAVTDAGVRLKPDWLRLIAGPLIDGTADVVAGFFEPDPHTLFETALGATVLPSLDDVQAASFLPSSRSIAFRKDVWQQVAGYPEWLDYCEDLIFDINLRSTPDVRVVFEPRAVVRFRPRPNLGAFVRQYFRYARGDGKADLWRMRHALRYGAYMHLIATMACLLIPEARRQRRAVSYLTLSSALGATLYLRKPIRRLAQLANGAPAADYAAMLSLLPLIRLTGDVAKMAGYPAGWWWRLRHHPPDWRR